MIAKNEEGEKGEEREERDTEIQMKSHRTERAEQDVFAREIVSGGGGIKYKQIAMKTNYYERC
mgnify:FL=1